MLIIIYFVATFSEIDRLAQYLKVGSVVNLIHDGQRYLKNGESGSKTYWRCSEYRLGCRARATTETIAGYDVVSNRKVPHTHPPTMSNTFHLLDVKSKWNHFFRPHCIIRGVRMRELLTRYQNDIKIKEFLVPISITYLLYSFFIS